MILFSNVTEVVTAQSIIIMPQELPTSSWHKWELALKPNERHFKQQLPEYSCSSQLLKICSVLWQEFRVGGTLQAVVFLFKEFTFICSLQSGDQTIIKPLPSVTPIIRVKINLVSYFLYLHISLLHCSLPYRWVSYTQAPRVCWPCTASNYQ